MNADLDSLDRNERCVITSVVIVVLAFFLSAFMEVNRSIEHAEATHAQTQNARISLDRE